MNASKELVVERPMLSRSGRPGEARFRFYWPSEGSMFEGKIEIKPVGTCPVSFLVFVTDDGREWLLNVPPGWDGSSEIFVWAKSLEGGAI